MNVKQQLFLPACLLALSPWSIVGCTHELTDEDRELLAESVEQSSSPLQAKASKLWSVRDIPVCWSIDGDALATTAAQRQSIYDAMVGQRSWLQSGNVNLIDWGFCASSNPAGIELKSASLAAVGSTSYLGRSDTGVAKISFDFTKATTDRQRQNLALHEFGHALGLAHEHHRSDTPTTCTANQGNAGETPWGAWDQASIMESSYCGSASDLSGTDRLGFGRFYGSFHGDRPRLGDYDGDGRDDLLCHDISNGALWIDNAASGGTLGTTDWSDVSTGGWCAHQGGQVYKGDFNGDGRADLLCHDTIAGSKWIDYANGSGTFGGTDWQRSSTWCRSEKQRLFIGDFNGDGRDDLLCHHTETGKKWVDLASSGGQFNGTNWSKDVNWCSHSTGRLSVGDFNGDGRDDLLCHDIQTGAKWVDYANSSGQFHGTNWSSNDDWCGHDDGELHVGDFNGDGRDDMLCHDVRQGVLWVDYASSSSSRFGATDWWRGANFCAQNGDRLFVGDLNGDGRDDLVCHNVSSGAKSVDLASSSGQFNGVNSSTSLQWCGHAAGEMH